MLQSLLFLWVGSINFFLPQPSFSQYHHASADGMESGPASRDPVDIQRAGRKQASKQSAVSSEAAAELLSAGDLKLHSPHF